jgi:hypothetical protein
MELTCCLGLVLAARRARADRHRGADLPAQHMGPLARRRLCGLSAMLTVIVMFVFPLWAIALLTIDFLVLFGLLTESDEFLAVTVPTCQDRVLAANVHG